MLRLNYFGCRWTAASARFRTADARYCVLALAAAAMLLHPSVAAAALRNCGADSSDLACRLHSILKILYGAAIVLGILLLGVVWAAVRLYRRNRSGRLTGDDDDD